jgi:hypothetical protein
MGQPQAHFCSSMSFVQSYGRTPPLLGGAAMGIPATITATTLGSKLEFDW